MYINRSFSQNLDDCSFPVLPEMLLLVTNCFYLLQHDTTVAALLSALNLFANGTSPPYAASVLVELHQNSAGKYYVNVLYKNTTDRAYLLTVPGKYLPFI